VSDGTPALAHGEGARAARDGGKSRQTLSGDVGRHTDGERARRRGQGIDHVVLPGDTQARIELAR